MRMSHRARAVEETLGASRWEGNWFGWGGFVGFFDGCFKSLDLPGFSASASIS